MVVFSACDPMEDVYDELDALKGPFTKKVDVTLSSEDYTEVKGKSYFTTEEKAAAAIPEFLNEAYSHLENGSTVRVTYNKLMFPGYNSSVSEVEKYTAVAEDYDFTGESHDNFNSAGDLVKLLEHKYPDAVENQLVVLTYDYYQNGATSTVTDSFYFKDGAWRNIYHVSDEDYASVGKRSDFSSSDDDLLPEYFNKLLSNTVFGAVAGDVKYVSYAYYSNKTTTQQVLGMVYNGSEWVKVNPEAVEEAVLQLKKKQGTWVPDLTKSYTLVADDYVWISKQPELGTQPQRDNLGDPKYLNFYQSWAGNDNYWSDEDVLVALSGFLKNKFPNEEVGQKFEVTYAYYKSGNKTNTVTLIKRESGDYTLAEEGE